MVFSKSFIVSVLVMPSISDMLIRFVQLPAMSAVLSAFPFTVILFTNLPVISLVMAVILLFASYGKREDAFMGGGGY